MKVLALLLCSWCLAAGQVREGNFNIRFEPTAKLQAGVDVPFQVTVKDSLNKPVSRAKVTLQIETPEHGQVKVFPAPAIQPGVYVAKPVFPEAGQWDVYVEVRRDDQMSARTIQFSVQQ